MIKIRSKKECETAMKRISVLRKRLDTASESKKVKIIKEIEDLENAIQVHRSKIPVPNMILGFDDLHIT